MGIIKKPKINVIMGYYTTFGLSVRNGEVTEEMQTKLKEIQPDYFSDYGMEVLIIDEE